MDPEVRRFVISHRDHLDFTSAGKIVCKLTQHEMPARLEVVQQHLRSKRFLRARDWYSADFTKYEPRIVPHRRDKKKLFCTVTRQTLNRIPTEVERHVNGKRYTRQLAEIERKEAEKRQRETAKAERRRAVVEGRKRARAEATEAASKQSDGSPAPARGAKGVKKGSISGASLNGKAHVAEGDVSDDAAADLLLRQFDESGGGGEGDGKKDDVEPSAPSAKSRRRAARGKGRSAKRARA